MTAGFMREESRRGAMKMARRSGLPWSGICGDAAPFTTPVAGEVPKKIAIREEFPVGSYQRSGEIISRFIQ
jgi:hypothetical protein